MRDLNEIQCFVKAVELKSITAAAKALDLPKSSVSRKISNLEKRLGLTLMIRTTRALNLTDAGSEFFNTALAALKEIESAEKGLDQSRQEVEGLLRVTAPADWAIGPLPRMIAAFLKAYPRVSIDLVLTERVLDLVAEGIDVAIRIATLKDSTLMTKKLGSINAQVVASPDYLKARGDPKTIADIEEHEWVKFAPGGVTMKWSLKSPEGKKMITPRGRFTANHAFALKQAAVDGLGFAVLPKFMMEEEIRNKTLKVVCARWQLQGNPVNMVYPAQKFLPPKLRHFIDFAAKHLAG